MKTFLWLLVVLAAASAQREIPFEPLKGSQLLSALKTKHVCDTIPADVLVNDTRRVTSDRVALTMRGGAGSSSTEATSPARTGSFGRRANVCLRMNVSHPNHNHDGPLALVEAGNVTAVAKRTGMGLEVITRNDGSFRILPLCVLETMIGELAFQNSTITWNGKELDTKDPLVSRPNKTCALESKHGDFPVMPWAGSQLARALRNGRVCETIPADARFNDTHRVTSDQWPDDAWWSWFELYGGRFNCSNKGIRKDGDCLFTSCLKSQAVCFLVFSRIRMRYS
ncbi:hypothetical protein MTO96_028003 [Rhipicephalus appendiculatus]